jgi:hypothetical protein
VGETAATPARAVKRNSWRYLCCMAFTDTQQRQFLDALAQSGVAASACRTAGVPYSTVNKHRKTDDDFAAAWDDALEQATDTLETEARRRALEGVPEPVIHQGQLTPLWERDFDGQVVMERYEADDGKGGKISASRPRQLVKDGVPQYLTVRKHSDALMMFLLKGNRAKFKDSSKVELSNPDGTLTPLDDTTKAARLATLMALAVQREAAAKAEDFGDLA